MRRSLLAAVLLALLGLLVPSAALAGRCAKVRTDRDGDCVPNSRDRDIDGDGRANWRDPDMDGDGVANRADRDLDGDHVENTKDRWPFGVRVVRSSRFGLRAPGRITIRMGTKIKLPRGLRVTPQ